MNAFKICYVSSEVTPFANTATIGDLADHSRALPIALKEMDQDVRLMMPKYKSINERKYVLREVIRLQEVQVELNGDVKQINGKTAFLPDSKVHVYFLSVPEYFDRKGYYDDPQNGKTYKDNAERFGYFCKGVLETLKLLYWQPDIIHCSDWPTALIPFYLKTHYKDDEFFQNTHTVFTVHNFAEQGVFPLNVASKIGIGEDYAGKGKALEQGGKLNFLKAGLGFADIINTASEQQAADLLEDGKKTHGLNDVISSRKKNFFGIGKGTSFSEWDPETDKKIAAQYDAKSLNKKGENKIALQAELQLTEDEQKPLIAVISRLNDDSGFDVVLEALKDLLKKDLQIVVMAKGSSDYDGPMEDLADANPDKLIFIDRFDKKLSHLMVAGADLMLIPSKSGLEGEYHLSGLRYGTVPVLLESGGFLDSIKSVDPESGKGNGIFIPRYNKTAVVKAVLAAIKLREDEKLWTKIQKNAMKSDVSWEGAAKKYLKLYDKASRSK